MKILLMGPQASGKGTQGEKLSKYLGIPLISNGEILRSLPENHKFYEIVHKDMDVGNLVDQRVMAELIEERVTSSDCSKGYILDGWGRKDIDLEYFDPGFDFVLLINIPREESIKRISGRRICSSDGKIYNIYTLPKEELEKCQGDLVQRDDDTEEAVKRRLDIYYSDTQKVLDRFKQENKLVEADGVGTPDEVFSRVLSALERAQSLK